MGGVAQAAICNLLSNLPLLGYILYNLLVRGLEEFWKFSPQQQDEKFGSWSEYLRDNEKILKAWQVTASAAKKFRNLQPTVQNIGTYVAGKIPKPKGSDKTFVDFAIKVGTHAPKYWLIYFLQTIASTIIRALCVGAEIITFLVKALKEFFSYGIWTGDIKIGEQFTDFLDKTYKHLNIRSLYAGTGPLSALWSTIKIIASALSGDASQVGEVVIRQVLGNETILSGLLQLIAWCFALFYGFKQVLKFGNVPPRAKNIAKMGPLLQSKILEDSLTTLRLPIVNYTLIEVVNKNKPEIPKEQEKEQEQETEKSTKKKNSKPKPKSKKKSKSKSKKGPS